MEPIKRKIYFYKVFAKNSKEVSKEAFELLQDSFNSINIMPYSLDGRYQKLESYKQVSCELVSMNERIIKGKIGYRRTGDLPLKEKDGNVSSVGLLSGESLYEPTHFVFFKSGILGVEYNHFGPRTGTIRSYILDKCDEIEKLSIQFLYKDDIQNVIASVTELYEIDISANADNIENFRSLDGSLHEGLSSMKKSVGNSDKIKFQMSRNARNKKGIFIKWLPKLPEWIRQSNNHEITEKLKIKAKFGDEDKARFHDLLEDKFVQETKVIKQDSTTRAVNSVSMYNEILNAYNELRDELINAF